jgi:hypothetical protein
MFVPHVEAGHPGQTDLADIDEILEVTIQRTPNPISTHC